MSDRRSKLRRRLLPRLAALKDHRATALRANPEGSDATRALQCEINAVENALDPTSKRARRARRNAARGSRKLKALAPALSEFAAAAEGAAEALGRVGATR